MKFIVEGANVFFDDAARRLIASTTAIKQIKDTTANKGGVFSSSIAEVLTAFLFGDEYESSLLNDVETRWALIRDIMALVDTYARAETEMLIRIHDADPLVPLFDLSERTSEQIFALQAVLEEKIADILEADALVWEILAHYIPAILVQRIGKEKILNILSTPELATYRDATLTKKLASMAFYRYGLDWEAFLRRLDTDFAEAMMDVVSPAD